MNNQTPLGAHINVAPIISRPETHNSDFNSAASQRTRLLVHLRKHGSISTIEAREQLDIMHPAARIQELKGMGNSIDLVWSIESTAYGKTHRVGQYYLIKEANHGPN